MKDYKVSIITVVYNGASTIEQTILSVLGQTYANIEYIIVDGLSNDGTQQIIEKYIDSISCFLSEKDNGIYDAMNKGIQRATGDIIGIINSDDWYAKDAVEKVVEFFSNNDTELVYGKIFLVYPDLKERLVPTAPLETIWYQMAVPHPSVFVKKEIYNRLGTFDLKYKVSADYELLLRFYSRKVKFGFIDKPIAYFRSGGISTVQKDKCTKERKKIIMDYISLCPNGNEMLAKFENWYSWDSFLIALKNENKVLTKLIKWYFDKDIHEIVIFGTGTWAGRCYEMLKNGSVGIKLFADNNPSKWNKTFHGIRIVNPLDLKVKDFYVLIAVLEYGKDIKDQLIHMGIGKPKIVYLEELKNLYNNIENNY